jgi:hypothetical protein
MLMTTMTYGPLLQYLVIVVSHLPAWMCCQTVIDYAASTQANTLTAGMSRNHGDDPWAFSCEKPATSQATPHRYQEIDA